MPYKTDKLKLDCPFFDRRSKLLPCQKERLIILYNQGYSQRKLAAIFSVSRRLVQFVACPEKKAKDLQNYSMRFGCTFCPGMISQHGIGLWTQTKWFEVKPAQPT